MSARSILSRYLIAAALVGTPLAASADTAPVATQSMPAQVKTATTSDATRYAELEKQTPAAAKFEGGAEAVYIGGSVLTVVLIILLIVIIL